MASTFASFEAAKSGLSIAMQQLKVTEQNIANVNTPGYTRQRLVTSAKEPGSSNYLIAQIFNNMVGQGAEATGVQQIRSAYLDQQYRNLNSNYNYSSSRNQAMDYLGGLFNETNMDSGLTTSIENYFGALKDFTSDTSSKAFRTNVQQQALSMTDTFNTVYGEMVSLWHDQNNNISTTASKINSVAQKIAQLNDSIARSVQMNGSANELNDQRNLLLDELSGYVNITYSVNTSNNNMVDVQIGGESLVDGNTVNPLGVSSISDLASQVASLNSDITAALAAVPPEDITALQDSITTLSDLMQSFSGATIACTFDPTSQLATVTYNGVNLVTSTGVVPADTVADGDMSVWVDLNKNNIILGDTVLDTTNNTIKSGQLFSDIEMTTSSSEAAPGIPFYMDRLNTLVRDIAQNINNIHQQGYTYPDGSLTSKNNVIFFDVPQQVVAGVPVVDANGNKVYDYSKINAGNFTLSEDVLDNVYNIAGSSKPVSLGQNSTETGNNEIAMSMFKDLEGHGYYDKLDSIVNNLAITANTNGSIMKTRQSLVDSADAQRISISGVSLDEETTNLIIFQQSYQAAARIISTLDDMLSTMINNMGITGR